MRKIGRKKYAGWQLARVSLELDVLILDLARLTLRPGENIDEASRRARARLIFTSTKKIVLSKLSCPAQISALKSETDADANVRCILECSPDSFLEVTAKGFAELQY
jgi:hypothetical protein